MATAPMWQESHGPGDSDRDNIGYSPGSYLIDVKVLNDIGTTNSQATLRGINWVANNVNTDWGNNESSRGIDVMSMSFGSISNPEETTKGMMARMRMQGLMLQSMRAS